MVEVMVVVVSPVAISCVDVVDTGGDVITTVLTLVVRDGVTTAGPRLAAALNHETKTILETINSSESVRARRLRLKDSTS